MYQYRIAGVSGGQEGPGISISEEQLRRAREVEYRFRNSPFEERFGAMLIAAIHGVEVDRITIYKTEGQSQ